MADDSFDVSEASEELGRGMRSIEGNTAKLSTGANSFARAITSAFAQGATGAKSFDTVLKSLALRLSNMSLNLAMKPLTAQLAGGIDKLFGGIAGAFTGGGSIVPNAKGGVIAAPTYFPMGGGRTGLAGEAGPEAIMPLTRGADGRLGVAASGGAASNITVNIATPDAESFRRSEAYLTGVVARAVARGQRGL
jgi:phage-related minor tail protein